MIGAQHHLTPTQETALAQRRAFHAKIAAQAVPDTGIVLREQRRADPLVLTAEEVAEQHAQQQAVRGPFHPWFKIVGEILSWPPSVDEIQRATAARFRVSRADIKSERREAVYVRPRQVAMFLARQYTSESTPSIGRRFGNRDHTTVIHAIRKIDELLKRDAELRKDVEAIQQTIRERRL